MNPRLLVPLAILGFVALAAVMTLMMLSGRRHRVEVCQEYRGRTVCRTAAGPTREEAVRTAIDNACALLASGMTDSMQCGATPPRSVRDLD